VQLYTFHFAVVLSAYCRGTNITVEKNEKRHQIVVEIKGK